jgi:hypothetical protein
VINTTIAFCDHSHRSKRLRNIHLSMQKDTDGGKQNHTCQVNRWVQVETCRLIQQIILGWTILDSPVRTQICNGCHYSLCKSKHKTDNKSTTALTVIHPQESEGKCIREIISKWPDKLNSELHGQIDAMFWLVKNNTKARERYYITNQAPRKTCLKSY